MKPLFSFVALAALVFSAPLAQSQAVYKCVDGKGASKYSDTPCASHSSPKTGSSARGAVEKKNGNALPQVIRYETAAPSSSPSNKQTAIGGGDWVCEETP